MVALSAVAAAAVAAGPSVVVVGVVAAAAVALAVDAGEVRADMVVAEGEDLPTAGPRRPAGLTVPNRAAVSVVRFEKDVFAFLSSLC